MPAAEATSAVLRSLRPWWASGHPCAPPRRWPLSHRAAGRVAGDHTALELEKLDELEGRRGFVVARRQGVGQRHAGLCRPRRHHDGGHVALATFVSSPKRLAIESNDAPWLLDLRRTRKHRHEPPKRLLEGSRVEHTEHPAERVVARDPVLQPQDGSQQVLFRLRKQGDVAAAFGATQRCQERDEQQFGEIVQCILGPRIGHLRKAFRKTLHGRLLAGRETFSESSSLVLAIAYLKQHAIPLRAARRTAIPA